MKKFILLLIFGGLLLTACGGTVEAAPKSTATVFSLPSPTVSAPPLETMMVTLTLTSTSIPAISPTPTPTWVVQGPDSVVVPILLYHRIGESPVNSQYYVSPDKFEAQMKLLHDWEYTIIPIESLVTAIKEGAHLPPRPLIITFDDGDISVYNTAYPIMQKYGLTGVVYIVGNYMGTEGYMTAEQIKDLVAAGWEVGSHSRSHNDLRSLDPAIQKVEIVDARKALQLATGSSVDTFAYPYGFAGDTAGDYVHAAGYVAAMGLGFTCDQGKSNLFWLQRRDVRGQYDIKQFAGFLPWQGDPACLPPDTPTPTPFPSRTPIPTYTPFPTSTTQP